MALVGKEPTCQCRRQETLVWSLGLEDPLKDEMATHSSILAWRTPWTEEPGVLQAFSMDRGAWCATGHGVTETQTWLSDQHSYFTSLYKNQKWPSLLGTLTCPVILKHKYWLWPQIYKNWQFSDSGLSWLQIQVDLAPVRCPHLTQ